eukprot:CAMPEP_0206136606 /NCGR_PEP_ID=MMETSP1473-20131121/1846_1 /ASSEMBLY_ACC=CAM_ASM_001109 /TAXON_ID=1461547 /ORGANISM="Stichococcus sp, Strain RCC1054" /LENGTH=151 /DNA_ID=CAMNT_0053529271 /DNA_START=1156 /DNA_END=1612 /DNA_ORIENTATION=+
MSALHPLPTSQPPLLDKPLESSALRWARKDAALPCHTQQPPPPGKQSPQAARHPVDFQDGFPPACVGDELHPSIFAIRLTLEAPPPLCPFRSGNLRTNVTCGTVVRVCDCAGINNTTGWLADDSSDLALQPSSAAVIADVAVGKAMGSCIS